MAHVVFLRGVNVGGHKTFRPKALVERLSHLDVVNIGAAGTFVVRRPISQAQLRRELAGALPFETEIMICNGRDVLRLVSKNPFAGLPVRSDVVHFVSVLAKRPRSTPALPMRFPSAGPWLLEVLARDGRFVIGLYQRQMKAIRYLGTLDQLFGTPVTTRNWNTITAIAKALRQTDSATRKP